MSKNGGYVIIDFKDINITSEAGVTVVGIFNDIESSGRKAILVSGVTLDGVEQRDVLLNQL